MIAICRDPARPWRAVPPETGEGTAMTKRRAIVLAVIWLVLMTAMSGWIASRTDVEVSAGDAALVGAVAATAVTAAAAGVRRK